MRIQGDQFVLADDPTRVVKLKGSNFQTVETPWELFSRWDEAIVDRTLALCKNMGCNCIRAFVPLRSPEYQELWDKLKRKAAAMGMRMYASFTWPNKYAAADTAEYAADRDALVRVLRRYAADPGIIAWDIINEPEWVSHSEWQWKFNEPEGRRRLDWLLRIADVIHEHDTYHPVTIGFIFNYSYWTPDWARPLLERLDFVDFHYYHRTYAARGIDTAIREIREQTDKPIVVGEFGQSSDPEYSKPPHETVHSEETQRALYEHAMKAIVDADIVGGLQWSTCSHNDQPREAGENEYGIHRQDHSPKPAVEVFTNAMHVPLFAD